MAFLLLSAITVCILVVAYLLDYTSKKFSPQRVPHFPGPPADPIVGHARIFPLEYQWKTFVKWGKEFGDIMRVHVLNKEMLLLNSFEDMKELLERRGNNYSSRPRFVLAQEMMGWGQSLAFLRYGNSLKRQRKMIQPHWSPQSVTRYHAVQYDETHRLLLSLLERPDDFAKHLERAIASSITTTTYGHHISSDDDPFMHIADVAAQMTAESGILGGTPVDFFPFLKHLPTWMPGAGFKRHAIKTREAVRRLFDEPYDTVKTQRAEGKARPSFLTALLDIYEIDGHLSTDDEENIKSVCGTLYGAAVETTMATLLTFVLAMTIHPSVVKRAQKELDEIVGHDRLPDFGDRGRLPYIECIIKEVSRWNPPLPLGIPHTSIDDDVYRGRRIEKGTMVLPNIWACSRDPNLFPDPEVFSPERFLENDIKEDGTITERSDRVNAVFGFGRRICPGKFFANNAIWLTISSILMCFDILPPLDENGRETIPKAEFASGATSQPKDFKCRFKLRSERSDEIIRRAADVADAVVATHGSLPSSEPR